MRQLLCLGLVCAIACGGNTPGVSPTCGDRTIDDLEDCDDGNLEDGDGCSGTCKFEPPPNCGDSMVQFTEGEECDDGNTAGGDGCDGACKIESPESCGDDVLDLQLGEECDDGNTDPGDGCSPACQFEAVGAFCGDGIVDANEVCDDSNTANGDTCNPTCNFTNTTSIFAGQLGMPGRADGIGTAAQIGGNGVLVADATHLYLADGSNRLVRTIDVSTGTVTTIAGDASGGPPGIVDHAEGLMARFIGIEAIATDGSTIWVADGGRRIRAISLTPPHAVTTVAGSGNSTYAPGTGTAASFDDVRGLTYYAGKVYFVDSNAAILGSFDPVSGEVITLAGTPYVLGCASVGGTQDDGVGAAAKFCSPRYMASDNSGNLYVADTNGGTMRTFNTTTNFAGTLAGNGGCDYADGVGPAAVLHRPRGMTSDGTNLFWVEHNAHTIRQAVVATATVSTMIGTPITCALTCSCAAAAPGGYLEGVGSAAEVNFPFSVSYHFPSRSLFFVDGGNAVIRRIQ